MAAGAEGQEAGKGKQGRGKGGGGGGRRRKATTPPPEQREADIMDPIK